MSRSGARYTNTISAVALSVKSILSEVGNSHLYLRDASNEFQRRRSMACGDGNVEEEELARSGQVLYA